MSFPEELSSWATSIDPEKGLVLQLDSGGIRMFDAAHTSIIKNWFNSKKVGEMKVVYTVKA